MVVMPWKVLPGYPIDDWEGFVVVVMHCKVLPGCFITPPSADECVQTRGQPVEGVDVGAAFTSAL